jgi:prepilin-type N-terminal cleavage/methylation domain-containing protein
MTGARSGRKSSFRANGSTCDTEDGYTLIELLVVSLILPLILGAISVALISVLSLQGGVSNRITDSSDAQIVSAHLDQDVQSALRLTTNPYTTQCGPSATQTQLLGLEWSPQGSS